MDRSELINEIKKQLQEEMKFYRSQLESSLPPEQREQLQKARETSTQFIRQNPWLAAGLAATAGFLIARFFYRERQK